MENYGCRVNITLINKRIIQLRNVTEIHYSYPSYVGKRIAFESDIHSTGTIFPVNKIAEFETKLECEKAEDFEF